MNRNELIRKLVDTMSDMGFERFPDETTMETKPLKRADVVELLDELEDVVRANLKKDGVVNLGFVKLVRRRKPAVPAGVRKAPFTGEERHFPRKPARTIVKATVPKKFKDQVL